MNHPRIELKYHWKQNDLEASERITQILSGCTTQKEIAERWYDYLHEHLKYPFFAYVKAAINDIPNQTSYSRIKIKGLTEQNRCGYDTVWFVGHPSYPGSSSYHFFLTDMSSVETTIHGYQLIQDYIYWYKKIKK